MKKVLLFSLFLLLIGCDEAKENSANPAIWNGTADTKWYNKSATEFTITTPEQLAGLAKLVNGGNDFYGKTIKLGADIMLNDTADWQNWASKPPKNEWKSIGTYISEIDERTPTFLRNHTGDALIFIFVPKFIAQALRLTDTDLSFRGTFDGGGFAVSGVYINTLESHQGLFGNIKMYKKAELRNLGVRASYIKGGGSVGGLVGLNAGKVSSCYSVAWVAGEGVLGGLVGNNFSTHAIIINSYSTGTVTGGNHVGGLAGGNSGTISGSYFAGKVSGKTIVGGLVGSSNYIISDSYFTGTVSGDSIAGGLAGTSIGRITNSYSIGTVAGKNDAGELVGSNEKWEYSIVKNSYYNMETNRQSKGIGADNGETSSNTYGKTAVEMKKKETFAGWDFEKTWGIDEKVNGGYPHLRNMPRKTE